MFELILAADANEQAAVCEAVGERGGITVADCDWWKLQEERTGVDALVMEGWPASDNYGVGRHGHDVAWVVLDTTTNAQQLVYPTLVTHPHPEYQNRTTAAWIAVLANLARPELATGGDPALKEAAERGRAVVATTEGGFWFARYLDAFEAMERNNTADAQPPIRRVGIRADGALDASSLGQMAGLLVAYAAYRERALAGAYGPGEPASGGDAPCEPA